LENFRQKRAQQLALASKMYSPKAFNLNKEIDWYQGMYPHGNDLVGYGNDGDLVLFTRQGKLLHTWEAPCRDDYDSTSCFGAVLKDGTLVSLGLHRAYFWKVSSSEPGCRIDFDWPQRPKHCIELESGELLISSVTYDHSTTVTTNELGEVSHPAVVQVFEHTQSSWRLCDTIKLKFTSIPPCFLCEIPHLRPFGTVLAQIHSHQPQTRPLYLEFSQIRGCDRPRWVVERILDDVQTVNWEELPPQFIQGKKLLAVHLDWITSCFTIRLVNNETMGWC
jgi:hypothetical protein